MKIGLKMISSKKATKWGVFEFDFFLSYLSPDEAWPFRRDINNDERTSTRLFFLVSDFLFFSPWRYWVDSACVIENCLLYKSLELIFWNLLYGVEKTDTFFGMFLRFWRCGFLTQNCRDCTGWLDWLGLQGRRCLFICLYVVFRKESLIFCMQVFCL